MDRDFQGELIGTEKQAIDAKGQIAKSFELIGKSGGAKNQLIFAAKILRAISRCEAKHLHIYSDILNNIFGRQLKPEASEKYWIIYLDYFRHIHYLLVDKEQYRQAWLTFKTISEYTSKLQTENVAKIIINIYCYQLHLEIKRLKHDILKAVEESTIVVRALAEIFREMLQKNREMNYQYVDILSYTFQWLMPINGLVRMSTLYSALPKTDVEAMFNSLFQLYGVQKLTKPPKEKFDKHMLECLEILHSLLQFDIINKLDLKLSFLLLKSYRSSLLLKNHEAISIFFQCFAEYMEAVILENPVKNHQELFYEKCNDLKTYFENNSKLCQSEAWFSQSIVMLNYMNNQLLDLDLFNSFWEKNSEPHSYNALLELIVELVKLCTYVNNQSKLYKIACCSSVRKHLAVGFAQICLATYTIHSKVMRGQKEVLCESMEEPKGEVLDLILKNMSFIVNYGLKVANTMDCITSTCPDMQVLLTRFKQITLEVKTDRQAATCVYLLELFLRIKQKISSKEWSGLLRRLYKTKLSFNTLPTSRDLQMCFIASLFTNGQELDSNVIKSQINCFYASSENNQSHQHDKCLLALYKEFNGRLKPLLNFKEKKMLYWFEMRHVTKYCKSNEMLMQSLIDFSPTKYDFVLAVRLSKLHSHAMKRLQGLYALLKEQSKNHLEHLTYAHIGIIFLLEKYESRKTQSKLDSKELLEDNLEQLLKRGELKAIHLKTELELVHLAIEAYQAFEVFYKEFSAEFISCEEASIDGELLMDDLTFLAQYLQSAGYLECSSRVWLLLYKSALLVQDEYAALKGLTFICEYSDLIDETKCLPSESLETEIKKHFPFLITSLNNVNSIAKRYQSTVLLAVLQIAYYYVRHSRCAYGRLLLQMVEEKHNSLLDRQGKYDLIKGNLDAIQIRWLCKHNSRDQAVNLLMNECLLRKIDETIDGFHDFVYISSGDSLSYAILLTNLTLEMAEYAANRMCDNFLNAFFVAILSIALQSGLALRFVHILSLWMWINLQQEHVDKAQVKVKVMEHVMGLKDHKELSQEAVTKDVLLNISKETAPAPNASMEFMRKLVLTQFSPLRMGQLQLNLSTRAASLAAFFNNNTCESLLPVSDVVEWSSFNVGCLTARLHFICEAYEQLDKFYEQSYDWLQKRESYFNKEYFKNIQLLAGQHHINYLRSQRHYEEAIRNLKDLVEHSKKSKSKIDSVYRINFELQLQSSEQEAEAHVTKQLNMGFDRSPEEKENQIRKIMREKALQEVRSTRKCCDVFKTQKSLAYKSESSSSTSSIESKDKVELIDLSDSLTPPTANKEQRHYSITSERVKSDLEMHTPDLTHGNHKRQLSKTASKIIVSPTDNCVNNLLGHAKENLNKVDTQVVIKKRGRKQQIVKQPSAPVIILEDSHIIAQSESVSKSRLLLGSSTPSMSDVNKVLSHRPTTRLYRQRKLLEENNGKLEQIVQNNLNTPLSCIRKNRLHKNL
uniref:Protein three rows n=1 Tax=Glossina morsitans morsitans TaxID=37546 RepID=A0ABK9NBQ0_GLOMM